MIEIELTFTMCALKLYDWNEMKYDYTVVLNLEIFSQNF